jgi:uncharacterized HAD superfamily protein
MVPACQIALLLNLPVIDLDGYLEGRAWRGGRARAESVIARQGGRILIVDDSVNHGSQLEIVRERLRSHGGAATHHFLAVFASEEGKGHVDQWLEYCPAPRFFEWNVMHHPYLRHAFFDMDGILCVDPTEAENDDGPRYARFLREALPLFIPTVELAAVVTSRLARYRQETEDWLGQHGVRYRELLMLEGVTAEERRRLGLHASFKAAAFGKREDAWLFVESSPGQAREIHRLTAKPVFCPELSTILNPGALTKVLRGQQGPMDLIKSLLRPTYRRLLGRRRGQAQ